MKHLSMPLDVVAMCVDLNAPHEKLNSPSGANALTK
jgi:hypothetical protein